MSTKKRSRKFKIKAPPDRINGRLDAVEHTAVLFED